MRALERNLWLMDLVYLGQNALFWIPIFILHLASVLPPSQVFLVEAVYYGAVVAFEVPSGWMSDRIGRRWTLALSALGWMSGALCIALVPSLVGIAIGQVLLASGRALASGTDSSMIYESLRGLGRESELVSRQGRASAFGFGMLAVAAVVGGLLGRVDTSWAYLASAVGAGVALVAAMALTEPPTSPVHAERPGVPDALRNPYLRWVFALAVLGSVLAHIPYELQQPWIDAMDTGHTALLSGLLMGLGYAVAAWGSAAAGRIRDRLGFARGMTVGFGSVGVLLGLMAVGPVRVLLPLLAFRGLVSGICGPLVDAEVHPRVPSSVRATYLSVQSLGARLVFAIVLVVMGWVMGTEWSTVTLQLLLGFFAWVALLGAGAVALGAPSRRRALLLACGLVVTLDLLQVGFAGKGLGALGGAVIYATCAVGIWRGHRTFAWVVACMPVVPMAVFAGLLGPSATERLVDAGMIGVFSQQVAAAAFALALLFGAVADRERALG